MNKTNIARISMVILSVIYFAACYFLLRQMEYYKSISEELSDAIRFKGPLAGMLMMSPQVYPLIMLAALLHIMRKRGDMIKQLMRIWSAIFISGSMWTALFIYLINNG
ncbi:hypothetical protein [Rhizobium leguminosarum]